jgi:hypothetical protein
VRCEGVAAAERESTAVELAACLRSAVETRSVRICEVFFVTLKLRNLDFFPDTAYPCPARIAVASPARQLTLTMRPQAVACACDALACPSICMAASLRRTRQADIQNQFKWHLVAMVPA